MVWVQLAQSIHKLYITGVIRPYFSIFNSSFVCVYLKTSPTRLYSSVVLGLDSYNWNTQKSLVIVLSFTWTFTCYSLIRCKLYLLCHLNNSYLIYTGRSLTNPNFCSLNVPSCYEIKLLFIRQPFVWNLYIN